MYAKKRQSELTVITRANELSSYIMTVTQKSPKQFRFTFTGRLQNASLNVLDVISESILILLTMTFWKLNLEKLLQMKGC